MSKTKKNDKKEMMGYYAMGFATGFVAHRLAGSAVASNPKLQKSEPRVHGFTVGGLLASMMPALALAGVPQKYMYTVSGLGSGVFVDDMLWHFLPAVRPVGVGEVGQTAIVSKYVKLVHIDENLPIPAKESQMLPIVPETVRELRNDADTVTAIKEFCEMMKIGKVITLKDIVRIRDFFLRFGRYVRDESLWRGHDRYRTISHLWRVFKKNGYFEYDCDCYSISVAQVLDRYDVDYCFILTSQRTERLKDGSLYHPLHHILLGVLVNNDLICFEGIKYLPPFPIKRIAEYYVGLKRVAILTMDGDIVNVNVVKASKR